MGTGVDLSIRELAEAADATGFKGLSADTSQPDGTLKKQLNEWLMSLGRHQPLLTEGLTSTIALFRKDLRDGFLRL